MYHFGDTMVIGNVDYSIVITGINQGSIETTNKEVSETMIAVIDEVFDELEKQNPNMTKEIEMPLGIIETDYLPGKVDKDGFDLHVPNTTKNKNIGYAKEK